MKKKLKEFQIFFGENRVRFREPLQLHTSSKVSGLAEVYLEVQKIEELIKGVEIAYKLKVPVTVFGSGSYLAIPKEGFKGLIIKNNCRRFEILSLVGKMKNQSGWKIDVDQALVYAEGGVIMNQLTRFVIEHGLAGLEYQLGLPGSVGGAIYLNSCFLPKRISVGDFVHKAKLITKEGVIKEVSKSYLQFDYKKSILSQTREIILSVIFKLSPMDKKILWERGTEALKYRSSIKDNIYF